MVDLDVGSFTFSGDGTMITSFPSNPVTMTGDATSTPSGGFRNSGSIAGGCTETYTLDGAFRGANDFGAVFSLDFVGPQCDCDGLGVPCVSRAFLASGSRAPRGVAYVAALESTEGSWLYDSIPGTAGADAACDEAFAGSSVCTISELRAAPSSQLVGATDVTGVPVTSFWAVDPAASDDTQCFHPAEGQRWTNQFDHIPSQGRSVDLNRATGTLVSEGIVACSTSHWVACCVP
jgi:hypothetical protein